MKEYQAGKSANEWQYVGLDVDKVPNQKVSLLTTGGIQLTGDGNTDQVVAFAPLIKRNKLKEQIIASMPDATREERHAAYIRQSAMLPAGD